jgi:hypothetical protein
VRRALLVIVDYSKILQTYSWEEILEWNEITEEETLEFLIDKGFLEIPQPTPVDCYGT